MKEKKYIKRQKVYIRGKAWYHVGKGCKLISLSGSTSFPLQAIGCRFKKGAKLSYSHSIQTRD